MCGIFGFSKLTEKTAAMAPFLAYAMEERGSHSWGATDGNECIRYLGPISKTFEIPAGWNRGIFHTRMASSGAVTIDNAHPFDFGRVKGIHNGTLSNHEELNREFNRNFEVDSMHIFANIVENRPLNSISGTATIAYYLDKVLHLCRINSSNLEVIKLKTGEIVFCSTDTPMKKAAAFARAEIEHGYIIHEYMDYFIETADENSHELVKSEKEHKFKAWTYQHGSHYSGSGFPTYNQSNYPPPRTFGMLKKLGHCAKCGVELINREDLLCGKDFSEYGEFIAEHNDPGGKVIDITEVVKPTTAVERTNNFIRSYLGIGGHDVN